MVLAAELAVVGVSVMPRKRALHELQYQMDVTSSEGVLTCILRQGGNKHTAKGQNSQTYNGLAADTLELQQ